MPSLPRLYHHDQRLVQWGDRLIAKIVAGEFGLELSNILYVDMAGDDNTAERGNIAKPFETIQAALNAAQEGDLVKVGPGVFSTAVAITWPLVNGVTLEGSDQYLSVIVNTGVGAAISALPAALDDIAVMTIRNFRVVNDDPAIHAINLDGSAVPNSLRTVELQNLFAFNDDTGGSIRVATAEEVQFENVDTDGGDVLLEEVQQGIMNNFTTREGGYAIDYDPAETTPPGNRSFIAHTGCVFGSLTVSNVAWVTFGKDNSVGLITADLIDEGANNQFGVIDYQGRVVTSVAITFDYQDDYHTGAIFDFASIGTTFSIADVGTSTSRMYAKARQAIFKTQVDQTITAGELCDLDLRGALFVQDALVVAGDGAIDRTNWIQLIPAASPIPNPTVFADSSGNAIPYPDPVGGGAVLYTVSFELQAAADAPVLAGAKSASGVAITGAGAPNTTGDIMITVHHPYDVTITP